MRSYFERSSHLNGARFGRNNRKISTQFKLLEFAEKETKRLITRNKTNEIEKNLQHIELNLNKLQKFKYSAQEILLGKGEMGKLELWSSAI